MAVTAVFHTTDDLKSPNTVENAIHPRPSLHLIGTQLIDNHGNILAELVEDDRRTGQYYWRVMAAINEVPKDPFRSPGDIRIQPEERGLFKQITILGQGRLNT